MLKTIPEPRFMFGIFTNTANLADKLCMQKCVVSIDYLTVTEVEDIQQLYLEIFRYGRLIELQKPELDLSDEYTRKSLDILLAAFRKRLCGKLNGEFTSYGDRQIPSMGGSIFTDTDLKNIVRNY